jgi:lipopolysaccharide export system permease protein
VVGLLAFGLTAGNLAARDNAWVPLIWVQAILPGVIGGWWIGGAPGWPRPARPPMPATP